MVYNPAPPIEKNPYISVGCSELISVMTAHDRNDRQSNWHYVIADIDAVIAGTYSGKQKRKQWDSIPRRRMTASVNAPISFPGKKNRELPETGNGDDTATKKLRKQTQPAETEKPAAEIPRELPPVVFDASKNRRSNLKLIIIASVLLLSACAVTAYFILR
ncbi:MAG: hypothetical protein PHV59_08795 [Victivallales bacterium]|nr:hypothetical protein [Victivallales bacterium]